jgi:hypothetical protein
MVDNDGLIAANILDGKRDGRRTGWKEIQGWRP